jgi:hypothetical protein
MRTRSLEVSSPSILVHVLEEEAEDDEHEE